MRKYVLVAQSERRLRDNRMRFTSD